MNIENAKNFESCFSWAAICPFMLWCALLLATPLTIRAQGADSQPEQLSKTRSDLYLRATRMPVADFADDINQLAVLSETCRAAHGAKACGLPEKALDSSRLEDRFAYYVKQPVEAHAKARSAKIDRRNWVGSESSAPPQRNQDSPEAKEDRPSNDEDQPPAKQDK